MKHEYPHSEQRIEFENLDTRIGIYGLILSLIPLGLLVGLSNAQEPSLPDEIGPHLQLAASRISEIRKSGSNEVKDRKSRYLEELSKLSKSLTSKGDLDGLLKVKNELEGWMTVGTDPIDPKDSSVPLELRKLRYYFDKELASLLVQSNRSKAKAVDEELSKLQALQIALTKATRLEDAVKVRDFLTEHQTIQPEKDTIPSKKASVHKHLIIRPLEKKHHHLWKIENGEWEITENKLIGNGNSSITFSSPVQPAAEIEFKLRVTKGKRAKLRFGNLEFGNNGDQRTLAIKKLRGREGARVKIPYELNRTYHILLRIEPTQTTFYLDSKKIDTVVISHQALEAFEFKSGDGYSKGTIEVSDLELRRHSESPK